MVEGVTGAVLHGSGRQAGARERAARWWRVASSWVWRSSRLSRSGGIDCGGWTERRVADSEERPAVRSGSGEQRRLHSKEWQYRSSHVQQQPATGRRTAGRLSACSTNDCSGVARCMRAAAAFLSVMHGRGRATALV